ncbi:MAG: P1 family peptidase [Clostridiales bacterium]|jgi:L-aminopeptidase/D-esterase-like protein|nr:P1 family peptidase [Clostridiales bacterium]
MTDKFLVGHAQDVEKGTGVTVILAKDGAVGGVSVRGAAPGTRETDLLKSENSVEKINAVVLSGGSAFGLESCSGVMEYLREIGCGFKAGKYRVPIVCGAVLYDLEYKEFAYPDKKMGYMAAKNAAALRNGEGFGEGADCRPVNCNIVAGTGGFGDVDSGFGKGKGADNNPINCNIGAGTGATIGKILGAVSAVKSGIGIHTVRMGAVEITAIAAVNAVGDVYGKNGEIIAGATVGGKFADTVKILTEGACVSENGVAERGNKDKNRDVECGENGKNRDTECKTGERNQGAECQNRDKNQYSECGDKDKNKDIECGDGKRNRDVECGESRENRDVGCGENWENRDTESKTGERNQGAECQKDIPKRTSFDDSAGKNTTIACLLTNAALTKAEANKLADIAHDGYAIAIRPVHTAFDGDTVFVMASGEKKCRFVQLGAAAVEATAEAIRNAVSNSAPITESRGNLLKTAVGVWKQSKTK